MITFKHTASAILAASFLALGPASVGLAYAQADHQITMQQADIRSFIDSVSMVTGKTFLVDPRIQGQVTISSEKSLTKSEVFEVFKDVLRVHGYTLIRTATGEYRVTLLQGAAQDAPFTDGNGINGRFATTVIKLTYTDSAEAARLIKPVMHSQGQVTANPGGSVLVITDFPENLRKAREIVAALDVSGEVTETIQLRQLMAIDAEDALKKLAGPKPRVKVVAIAASNSIILEGPPEDVARLRPVIANMDVPSLAPRGAVSVLPLRFADGAALVELLNTLLPTYTIEGQAVPTVAYESFSNTLVISAESDTQVALENIIRRLDVRRPQVLVEAIIVEISDTAAQDLGVQFALGGTQGSSIPLLSSNFSAAPNLLTLAGAISGSSFGLSNTDQAAARAAAFNSLTGLNGFSAGVGGTSGDAVFAAIINTLETDEESNILSTPFVTTLDNVPATFVPLLGDVPVVGRLFRNDSKSRVKRNLMVFLRPTIIRRAEDARPVTQNLLNRIRRDEMEQSGRTNSKIDEALTLVRPEN